MVKCSLAMGDMHTTCNSKESYSPLMWCLYAPPTYKYITMFTDV